MVNRYLDDVMVLENNGSIGDVARMHDNLKFIKNKVPENEKRTLFLKLHISSYSPILLYGSGVDFIRALVYSSYGCSTTSLVFPLSTILPL